MRNGRQVLGKLLQVKFPLNLAAKIKMFTILRELWKFVKIFLEFFYVIYWKAFFLEFRSLKKIKICLWTPKVLDFKLYFFNIKLFLRKLFCFARYLIPKLTPHQNPLGFTLSATWTLIKEGIGSRWYNISLVGHGLAYLHAIYNISCIRHSRTFFTRYSWKGFECLA